VKSIVGLVMGIIGSVFNMFLSIILGVIFLLAFLGRNALVENNLSPTLIDFSGTLVFWLIVVTILYMSIGILGLVGASMMNRETHVRRGGFICLVAGILSINPFLFVGGVMGLVVGGQGAYSETVHY